ncbi:MAG: branched-chain amino acid transport system permease protein [Rhodobacteraceae bacterium HLUCCA12]|nr:MAG: branched-chain amino acid transport system permease protein [Rhodobacteraceae bacterium HLUCCA12]
MTRPYTHSAQTARARPMLARLERLVPLLLLVAAVAGIMLLSSQFGIVQQRRVTLAFISLMSVVGLYVFMGNSGVLNFSSVGFMAIGAYVSALLTMRPQVKATFLQDLPGWLAEAQLDPVLGALAGGVAAALIALAVGLPIMRLSGIGAGIATLSILIIFYIVLGNWSGVTGGQRSLMGLPTYVTIWNAGLAAIGAIVLAFVYQESRSCLALRASREDEVAARAVGVRVVRERLTAFVLGAFICGIAGVFYGHFLGTLRVENFYLDPTFLYITMLVVGGMRSLTGAVLGVIVISTLTELLRLLEVGARLPGLEITLRAPAGLGDVVLAGLMLGIILFRSQGITGGREITLRGLRG